jgi:hypothetical protein
MVEDMKRLDEEVKADLANTRAYYKALAEAGPKRSQWAVEWKRRADENVRENLPEASEGEKQAFSAGVEVGKHIR